MPKGRSKKKTVRQNAKRQVRNKALRSSMRTAVKNFRASAAEDGKDAAAALPALTKKLDQATAKGVIHKNAASRLKSRLTRLANKSAAK